MSSVKLNNTKISVDEYLDGELISEIKHEYIDGEVYAMAGASAKHNLICKNILYSLENILRANKSPCDVFSSDMKVKISDLSTSFYYPDVLVTCDDTDNNDEFYKNNPVILVEVLSKSTRKNDKTYKKIAYFNIPSLQEYVIIEQEHCEVEVFRKNKNWNSTSYFLGDEIHFSSIDVKISVEDIYYHINNEDMIDFLKEEEI